MKTNIKDDDDIILTLSRLYIGTIHNILKEEKQCVIMISDGFEQAEIVWCYKYT